MTTLKQFPKEYLGWRKSPNHKRYSRKSKDVANFLKEYWGIRDGVGRNLSQNTKGTEDIAESE